jgi:CRP-like cAMP-binding protein
LIKVLAADINEVEKNMVSFSNGTSKNLIIKCLLSLHEKFGLKENKKTLDIYLTRKEYGEILGISTETVIRVFSQLQKDGYIKILGKQILIENLRDMQMEVI